MVEMITRLKLTGFSIEVKESPIELLLQTDKGPFNVEIPEPQLSKLVYALRFVQYAEEPLRKRRQKRQSKSSGSPSAANLRRAKRK